MRRLFVSAVVAALAMVPLQASAAASTTAAEFATKCSTGTYILGHDLTVRGGTGTLTNDCFIVLAEDVTLAFSRVAFDDIGGGCCAMIIGDSGRGSRIALKRATIDLHGAVQLAAGCCSGGDPFHPEDDGRLDARNSFVRGDTVELSASTADDFGTVAVWRTYVEARDTSAFALNIRASVPATGGIARVSGSHLVSAGDILVNTDTAGTTVVRNTRLDAAGTTTITTGAGGTCVSSGNTPPVACT